MEEENSCLFVPEIYKYSTKFVRIAPRLPVILWMVHAGFYLLLVSSAQA